MRLAAVLALKMSALLVSNLDKSKEFRRTSMSNSYCTDVLMLPYMS